MLRPCHADKAKTSSREGTTSSREFSHTKEKEVKLAQHNAQRNKTKHRKKKDASLHQSIHTHIRALREREREELNDIATSLSFRLYVTVCLCACVCNKGWRIEFGGEEEREEEREEQKKKLVLEKEDVANRISLYAKEAIRKCMYGKGGKNDNSKAQYKGKLPTE